MATKHEATAHEIRTTPEGRAVLTFGDFNEAVQAGTRYGQAHPKATIYLVTVKRYALGVGVPAKPAEVPKAVRAFVKSQKAKEAKEAKEAKARKPKAAKANSGNRAKLDKLGAAVGL